MIKRCCFFVVFFLMVLMTHGQAFNYYTYCVEEGLPSSETYDVLQDRNHFIWVASDKGVSRFDGYTFTNYNLKDGLPHVPVFKLYEDRFGRIWFLSYNGKLSYYLNGRIIPYKFNRQLHKKNIRLIDVVCSFEVLEDSSIVIGTVFSGAFKVDKNGTIKDLTRKEIDGAVYCSIEIDKQLIYAYCRRDADLKGTETEPAEINIFENGHLKGLIRSEFPNGKNLFYLRRKNGHVLLALHGQVLDYYKGQAVVYDQAPTNLISLYEDSDSCLWMGYYKGGVKKFLPNRPGNDTNGRMYFPQKQISKIMEDKEHGFWFTTLHQGVLYAPNIKIDNFSSGNSVFDEEKMLTVETDYQYKVYVGTNRSTVYVLSGGALKGILYVGEPGTEGIVRTLYYDTLYSHLYMGTYAETYRVDDENQKKRMPYVALTICRGRGQLYAGVYNGVRRNYPDASEEVILADSVYLRSENLCLSSNGTLWIGSPDGLYYLTEESQTALPYELTETRTRIHSLALVRGKLYAGTSEAGLLEIDITNKTLIKHIICDGGIYHLYPVNDSLLYVSSACGLILFDVKRRRKLMELNKPRGLLDTEVRQVVVLNDTVYAVTYSGVSFFNFSALRKNLNPPRVHIVACQVDTINYVSQKDPVFNYSKNYITFSFVGLNYRSLGKVKYRYRLKGYNSDWKSTNINSVQFSFLPAGKYTFEVVAINEDGVESIVPAKFSFTILQPFWKTTWFIMACVLLVSGIVFLILLIRYRRLKEKNNLLEQITDLRQRSMAMQMNPHFIFNSLNSIQAFLLSEDSYHATKYLSRFAKLIRMALYHSGVETVSLEEEMALLKLYLELERLRLRGRFDYEVMAEPSLNTNEVQIPPMLLQPLVENSIKHGIEGDKKGLIRVKFYRQGTKLMCSVEDDGKGIHASRKEKEHLAQEHKSLGMELTRQRVKLFCEKEEHEFMFSVMDKSDLDAGSTGTIIVFTLPGK